MQEDKVALILLPGLDGTGRLFGPFLERCPASFAPKVVCYPDEEVLSYDELEELVGEKCCRVICDIKDDVEVVTLDAPHLLLQCEPEEAWEAIEEFFGRRATTNGRE